MPTATCKKTNTIIPRRQGKDSQQGDQEDEEGTDSANAYSRPGREKKARNGRRLLPTIRRRPRKGLLIWLFKKKKSTTKEEEMQKEGDFKC